MFIFLIVAVPRLVDIFRHEPSVLFKQPISSTSDLASTASRRDASVPPAFSSDPLAFLSTASTDSLALLPGIGPVLAARITQLRSGKSTFISWEDLQRVHGIGPKTVARLKAAAEADR